MRPVSVATAALLLTLALSALSPSAVWAASEATLAPDRATYLVSTEVGSERWAIALRRVVGNPRTIHVTGSVFRTDAGPASFVTCQVQDDSADLLTDGSRVVRLFCRGAGACLTDATECSRTSWTDLGLVQLPASFFLPEAGLGAIAMSSSTSRPALGVDSLLGQLVMLAATGWQRLSDLSPVLAGEAQAEGDERGATLTYDGYTYLVTKDLDGKRWSIGLNLDESKEEILSVTGNVFDPSGGPPSFIYCTVPAGSKAKLGDLRSVLRLSCEGASGCGTTASSCAASDWTSLGDEIEVDAGFFLPPLGVPAAPQSDSGLVGIGTPNDPGSQQIGVPLGQGAEVTNADPAQGIDATAAATCPVGRGCVVSKLGLCADVNGTVRNRSGECLCVVEAPPECVGCGADQCGSSCEFAAGDLTARGQCLPAGAMGDTCTCLAIEAEADAPAFRSCGGPLGQTCGNTGACCADDPRDGCSSEGGDGSCAGVCVDPGDCDPRNENCGRCQQSAQPQPVCGNGVVEDGEECDGDTASGSCSDLGFVGGAVSCTSRCSRDTSGCIAPGADGPLCSDFGTCSGGDCSFDSEGYSTACEGFCSSLGAELLGLSCAFCIDPAECGGIGTGVGCVCDDAPTCGDGRVSGAELCDLSVGVGFIGDSDAGDAFCSQGCPDGQVSFASPLECTGSCEPVCSACSAGEQSAVQRADRPGMRMFQRRSASTAAGRP